MTTIFSAFLCTDIVLMFYCTMSVVHKQQYSEVKHEYHHFLITEHRSTGVGSLVMVKDFFRVIRPVTGVWTEVKALEATMDKQEFHVH